MIRCQQLNKEYNDGSEEEVLSQAQAYYTGELIFTLHLTASEATMVLTVGQLRQLLEGHEDDEEVGVALAVSGPIAQMLSAFEHASGQPITWSIDFRKPTGIAENEMRLATVPSRIVS